MNNKKVIVCGGSGFCGGHLVDKLIELGYEVHVIDNMSSGNYINHKAIYHLIDIGDCYIDDLVEVIEGSDCVFHLAAKARVQPSFDFPLEYHRTNVTGTLNLLEACKRANVKNFVFSSSSSVYGNNYDNSEFEEWDFLNPTSPYAMQKKIGEDYCRFYSNEFGINCKILRYFNVYGDRMIVGGQYAQAIQIFLTNYRNNEPFKVFGDGEQRRDFTHVSDVVEANILAMNYKYFGIFNIGTGTNHSINEVCNLIGGKIEYLPAKQEPKYTLAENILAKLHLKWQPKVKLTEWLNEEKFKRTM